MEEVEKHYQARAKELTDMLFDKGFLSDDLSRAAIQWLEEYIGYILQSGAQSAVKASQFSKMVRELEARQAKDEPTEEE